MKIQFKPMSSFVASSLKTLLALFVTFSMSVVLSSCDEDDDVPQEYTFKFTFSFSGGLPHGEKTCEDPSFVFPRQVGTGTSGNFG